MELNKIMQMAKEGKRNGLEALSKPILVDAVIKLTTRYSLEKSNSSRSSQLDLVAELQKELIHKADIGSFNSRVNDMERQLTATEKERDALQKANRELEVEMQQLRARVCELEKKIVSSPRVGRPEKYDKVFRANVKAYYKEGHTYKETAQKFKISTNTVGRILKE